MPDHQIQPHGGQLVDLMASAGRAAELKDLSRDFPSWDLTPRQLCDLEMILTGGFSPLSGFLCRADYDGVCEKMRLSSGALWPMPIVLDLPEELAQALKRGASLALRDPEGVMLAVLHVSEVWQPDREAEARRVFGTTSPEHPGVAHLREGTHPWYVGGRLEGVQMPHHYDFIEYRVTPAELRKQFATLG